MEPRATDAVPSAWEHTRRVLLQGFDPSKWLGLSVAAWLATLGGGRARLTIPGGSAGPAVGLPVVDERWAHFGTWFALAVAIAILVGLFALGVWVIVSWLNSRGAFALVDGVVRDHGRVVEPWMRYHRPATYLFWFRIKLGVVVGLGLGLPLFAGVLGLAAWSWLDPDAPMLLVPVCLALGGAWVVGAALVTLVHRLIFVVIDDLVVPVMYVRRCGVLEGMGVIGRAAMRWPTAFLEYGLVRVGLGLGVAVTGVVMAGLMCLVQWIPVIDVLLLLPVIVFLRTWSLHFVASLGGELAVLGPHPGPWPHL